MEKFAVRARLAYRNVLLVIVLFGMLFSTIVTLFMLQNNAAASSEGIVRLNMKSYGNHDELSFSNTLGNVPYDERILSIRPQYVIDNPPHGLYGEMDEQRYHEGYTYSYLLQNVKEYQDAGIKVIGYITGGYEGKGGDDHYANKWYSLETNKMLISNMATIDKVDGVFIDECSDFPDAASKSYLTELSNLAHSYGLIVWMNVGVDDFDEWYFTSGVADLMQSSEDWTGQSLSPVQKKWGSRIGVTGFKKSYTAQDAYQLTIDAWSKGLAFCYINTSEYTSIAPWFEEYAQLLREYGVTDVTPPYTFGHAPAKGSTGINPDTQITVHIGDEVSGADISSIIMTVEGIIVSPTITGTSSEYILTYKPTDSFAYGQAVDITIDAQDLATIPNTMASDIYSFTTALEPINHAPVLSPIGDREVTQGELLEFTINATDPDENELTYSTFSLPAGANFDSQTRVFSWIPVTAGTYPDVQFVVSDGELTDSENITITVSRIPTTVRGGGGGGGGGGMSNEGKGVDGYTHLTKYMTLDGKFRVEANASSMDGRQWIRIPKGTRFLTKEGAVGKFIKMVEISEENQSLVSDNAHVVGSVYKLDPEGATFDPPVILNFSYYDSDVPDGIDENNMVIAYWDQEVENWIIFEDSVVNAEENIISVPVNHFSIYTILGYEESETPSAVFELKSLSVSPVEVYVGDELSINMLIANTGNAAGIYQLRLLMDGKLELTKEVALDAGTSQLENYVINGAAAGCHILDVNGSTISFIVNERIAVVDEQSVPKISLFAITPNYDMKTHQLSTIEITYELSQLYSTITDVELVVDIALDSESLEALLISPPIKTIRDQIGGSVNYKPFNGWETGAYTFNAKLFIDGKFYVATSDELQVTTLPDVSNFRWNILGGIIIFITCTAIWIYKVIKLRRKRII